MPKPILSASKPVPENGIPSDTKIIPLRHLLLQAQLLLNDADEANGTGDYATFALQRQAREVLAAAIDQMTAEGVVS